MAISAECGQSIVDNGLYWWHRAILEEMARIESYGRLTDAIVADNMKYINRSLVMDSLRSIDQLKAAGMIESDEFGGIVLTGLGREWVQ